MAERRSSPPKGTRESERPSGPGIGSTADVRDASSSAALIPVAPPSIPPSVIDLDHQDAVTLKGIAGSPCFVAPR